MLKSKRFLPVLFAVILTALSLVMPLLSWASSVPGGYKPSEDKRSAIEKVIPESEKGLPDWNSREPFYLNNLKLYMTPEEIEQTLGKAKSIEEGFSVYDDNAIVFVRDDKLVNLSVSGDLGTWKLSQGGICYAKIGDCETDIIKHLGKPVACYAGEGKPLRIMLYSSPIADLGVSLLNGQVVGFMLTEPGLLGSSLIYGGYYVEAE
ncbi:MAG: hypothetical protein K6G50_06665 [bacterium]|nr:hypothetical protein [bacterium]